MDNRSRFYRSRYETAEQHAHRGERQKCLDICWELRLYPDLSLYRRAAVNLLIATVVDVRAHPDCDKFARECIELVEQIRCEDENTRESEAALSYLESHARSTLTQIHELQSRLRPEEADEEDPLAGFEEIPLTSEDKQVLNELAGINNEEGDAEIQEEIDEPDKPWTIEGMYTDYGYGYGRHAPQPKVDQQAEMGDDKDTGADLTDGMDIDTAGSSTPKQAVWSDKEELTSSTPTSFSDLPLHPRQRGDTIERSSPALPDDQV